MRTSVSAARSPPKSQTLTPFFADERAGPREALGEDDGCGDFADSDGAEVGSLTETAPPLGVAPDAAPATSGATAPLPDGLSAYDPPTRTAIASATASHHRLRRSFGACLPGCREVSSTAAYPNRRRAWMSRPGYVAGSILKGVNPTSASMR
jgi:hypothetical protein